MATHQTLRIIVAESAPIIKSGLADSLKQLKDLHPSVVEVDSKSSLLTLVSSEIIDLLIVNPTFGGILNPDEIRKASLNQDIKIHAIEIGKLSKTILSLYDDHIHITDDLNELKEKVKTAVAIEGDDNEEKESLSAREKEIIILVVKGMTNQEIADKLFLSVHTVMTHRRNIARKLQIHSATGLTIYAIVNNLVDLAEIKL